MTVLNPNFPKKEKVVKRENSAQKYGAIAKPNVKWTYNFDPLRNLFVISFFALLFAGFINHLIQESNKNNQAFYFKIDAEEVKRKHLENRLEIIKQETIAAEIKKMEK